MKSKTITLSDLWSYAMLAVILGFWAAIARGQSTSCPGVLSISASLGGCDNLYSAWIHPGGLPVVSQSLVYGDGVRPDLALSARSYSRTGTGCGAHQSITVTQTYSNGQTCVAYYNDNHNRSCDQCQGVSSPLSVVNAASFGTSVTADSIAAAFGAGISTETASVTTRPLPFKLGNVQVWVDDVPAELFFVSPEQVNFHIPANLSVGLKRVRATNAAGQVFNGDVYLANQAPGIPTVNSNGEGAAAADYGKGYLALFVTGINPLGLALSDVTLRTNNTVYAAQYIGKSGDGLTGIVQLNFLNIPINGQGAQLTVAGFLSNGVTLKK